MLLVQREARLPQFAFAVELLKRTEEQRARRRGRRFQPQRRLDLEFQRHHPVPPGTRQQFRLKIAPPLTLAKMPRQHRQGALLQRPAGGQFKHDLQRERGVAQLAAQPRAADEKRPAGKRAGVQFEPQVHRHLPQQGQVTPLRERVVTGLPARGVELLVQLRRQEIQGPLDARGAHLRFRVEQRAGVEALPSGGIAGKLLDQDWDGETHSGIQRRSRRVMGVVRPPRKSRLKGNRPPGAARLLAGLRRPPKTDCRKPKAELRAACACRLARRWLGRFRGGKEAEQASLQVRSSVFGIRAFSRSPSPRRAAGLIGPRGHPRGRRAIGGALARQQPAQVEAGHARPGPAVLEQDVNPPLAGRAGAARVD